MNASEIAQTLKSRFGDKITGEDLQAIDPWVSVAADAIAEVALFCRDEPSLAFDYLKDLSAVDWLIKDEKKAQKLGVEPHIEVLYHIFSFTHRHDFKLKVLVDRGTPEKLPVVPTVSHVWKVADWHEREAYDLMGIDFSGHPNLRRILCPEDWVGHPLRKDYEMPLEYHGIRCQ